VKNLHDVSLRAPVSSALRAAGAAYFALAGIVLTRTTVVTRRLIHEELLMRYVTSTIAACMLATTMGVFAQEQAPAQPPAKEQAPKEQAPPKSTLTGCVVQAKTTDGGTAYVLTKAEGGKASMYVLAGSTESNWSANVNKKVEVTGPVQEAPDADKDSPADSKVVRPPAMFVESVKVVAESCA
jgi:hypothetical protein